MLVIHVDPQEKQQKVLENIAIFKQLQQCIMYNVNPTVKRNK